MTRQIHKPGCAPCPTPGCGGRRATSQALCSDCWRRLPGDLRDGITAARRARARHLEAKAAIKATTWLTQHAPQVEAARRTGERVPP